jgi:hypothetical protein
MRHKTAVRLCSNWHGGQWSGFYQFASSGAYMIENHLRYLQEVESCLHAHEYALRPYDLSKKDERELTGLKAFFEHLGEKNGIKTVWETHPLYGYDIPYVAEDTPKKIIEKIYVIKYMK